MTAAQLALIGLIALAGPLLALPARLRIPVVIGELLVGALFGASGLGLLDANEPTFKFLGDDIGFALVMFVAGSQVPLRALALRAGLGLGAVRAVLIGVLAVPAGLALAAWFGTGNGLLYAVLIASSSAALILPSLSGFPLGSRPVLAMLAQVAIADAVCIVLLPLAIDPAAAASKALGVAIVLAASLLIYVFLRWAERSGRRPRLHLVSESRGFALELRISLILLFAIVGLAHVVGVSPLLSGFGAGLAVAAVGEPRRLARQLFGLTEGFFAPLFFVWLGASLNLGAVLEHRELLVLGLLLGGVTVVIHGLMTLTRQPLPIALLTSAQLGMPVAAVALGNAEGALAPGEDAALLVAAVVTVIVAAAVTGRVTQIAERLDPARKTLSEVQRGGARGGTQGEARGEATGDARGYQQTLPPDELGA